MLNQSRYTFPFERVLGAHRLSVEIVTDERVLDEIFALRYQIFNLELGEGLKKSHETQRDIDEFDQYCDHMAVIDKEKNMVVATYRLMPLSRAKQNIGFYSETEFDLSNIYRELPNSAELGRCCVHKDYRDGGMAINLLWCGLRLYMLQNDINYLFGCTSLDKYSTSQAAAEIYYVFKQQAAIVENNLRVSPVGNCVIEDFDPNFIPEGDQDSVVSLRRRMPSLLRGYLTLGAKIAGEPAYDAEFEVIDFFTLFDYSAIAKVAKRFMPE